MGSCVVEQAAAGRSSLKILDNDDKRGSNVRSSRVPARTGPGWRLRGKILHVRGQADGRGSSPPPGRKLPPYSTTFQPLMRASRRNGRTKSP
jgi:hypothetical protein